MEELRANHSRFIYTSRSGDKWAGQGRPALPFFNHSRFIYTSRSGDKSAGLR
jgi:hypothetical protein